MGISQEIEVASSNINEMTILYIKVNDCIAIVIKFDNMTFVMTQRNLSKSVMLDQMFCIAYYGCKTQNCHHHFFVSIVAAGLLKLAKMLP